MEIRNRRLFLIVFVAALGVLFAPVLLRGEVFALGDVPDQFLPWRLFTAEEVGEGRIPLWNPYTFCGAPFLANMQSAVLYPIDRMVDVLFGPVRGIGIGMAIHLFLGGGFLYLLARSFGASETSGGIAAIGYSFGGFHAIHLLGGNLLTITSSIYLPAHLWVIQSLRMRIEEGRPLGMLPLAAVMFAVLQVLSGHAQMTFYNSVFVMVFAGSTLIQMKVGKRRLILTLAGVAVCAGLLAAPQILPTLEYTQHSSRTGLLPFLPATEFSFGWEFLPTLFLPEMLGTRADLYTPLRADTYWGDWKNWSAVYMGFLPALGLVLFWLPGMEIRNRRRVLLVLGPLLLIGLVLSLGRNTPIYSFVHHHLPLFGKFRAPSKFIPGFIVPLAVMGALGIDGLLERLARIRMCHKRAFAWGTAAILTGGIVLGYSLRPDFLTTPILRSAVIQREIIRLLAMTLLAFGVFLFYIRAHREKRTPWDVQLACLSLLILPSVDVGLYFKKHLVFAPYEHVQKFPGEWIKKEMRGSGRLLATAEVPQVNDCVSQRILTAGGYDPFQVGRFVDHFRDRGFLRNEQIPDAWSPGVDSAWELGVTHVLSTQLLRNPALEPHKRNGPWALYRVKQTAPLVEFIPSESAVREGSGENQITHVLWRWECGVLFTSGEAPSPGKILVRNNFMPGWWVLDDTGDSKNVIQEPTFWMSVPVDGGEFDLQWVYRPSSWIVGVRLFWVGAVITLLLWVILQRIQRVPTPS